MATVPLSVQGYNDLQVQTALAAYRTGVTETPRRPDDARPGISLWAPADPTPETRMDTGDPRRVSVTPGRQGGRPRVHATAAEGNRARQRAYRARRRGQAA
jgi:hypothetical protein